MGPPGFFLFLHRGNRHCAGHGKQQRVHHQQSCGCQCHTPYCVIGRRSCEDRWKRRRGGEWRIAQNAGQIIHFGNQDTTTGIGGYLDSTNQYDAIQLLCKAANSEENVAERALKLVVIGRKNWLFVVNEGGGKASAVIYCLSQTCRSLKINPILYFEDVLHRIQGQPYNKLHELLPQNWAPKN